MIVVRRPDVARPLVFLAAAAVAAAAGPCGQTDRFAFPPVAWLPR
jgi:hypothetical protein